MRAAPTHSGESRGGRVKVEQAGDVRRARRALAVDEVAALLEAVPDQYKLLYRVLLSTGLRRGEAAQLQ